jgi:peptidoglycan/LPS O-acetylase OafA/YrhL
MRELDFLRGFAILGIVAIHVGGFSETLAYPSAIPIVTNYIAHFADFGIPVFFLISGFILAVRYFDFSRRSGFYRRRLMTVVPPYLAFTTLYLVYSYVALGQTSLYRAAWSYLLFDATGIFWFLAVIIQMYLLFPYLATWIGLLEMRGQAWKAPVYSAIIFVVWWAFLENWTANALNATWQPVAGFGNIVAERLFPGFLLFFVMGMYIARNISSWRTRIAPLSSGYMIAPLLLGAGVLTLLGSGFWWEMAVVPYSLVAAALLLRLSRWLASRKGMLSDSLEIIGRYSFGIYIAHILVMAVVVNRLWAMGWGAGDAVFYIMLYALTVGGCLLGLWALNLLPFGPLLSGVKKEKKKEEQPRPKIRRVI